MNEKAEQEYKAIVEWVLKEEDKVTNALKKSGKYKNGLDANADEYAYIYEERNKRVAEIKKKYDIS